ncbi:M48 family metalloprotease [Sphaerisporangium sp. NBC_01403]|uniref:M48 family metalloprotease n=1 Tax=Sphaerisporangium sp. NBC_01403 TaxID=2903599 RepID=UPI0032499415
MTAPPSVSAGGLCPSCSAPVSTDPRFVTWCPSCGWNVDPAATGAAPRGRSARRLEARRQADRVVVEQVYAQVAHVPSSRPRRDGSFLAAMVLAGSVHLVTAALTGCSIWLLITGNLVTRSLGAVGFATAVLLRPRLGRFRPDEWSLSRAEAPHLYDLADRVAAELGAPPIDLIRVTPGFNASYGKAGPRRRGILTIGMALWELLTPQERIALLGHELGHAVNGDARRGLWLSSAVKALTHWHEFTRPGSVTTGGEGLLFLAGGWIAKALLVLPNKLAELMLRLLIRFTLRVGQRAEYLADDLAARAGSSAATRSMLETLVLGDSVDTFFQRRAVTHRGKRSPRADSRGPDDFGLWQELREHIASIPEIERTRRLRVSALRMTSVDTTHPPTHLRVRRISARKPEEAAITLDEAETASTEAELAAVRARVARVVLN